MSSQDWRWKIGEVIERVRTRYDFIGRKTGAPFLALVYPPEAEAVFFKEWQTQQSTLRPDFDVRSVNVLEITQAVTADIGVENIVGSLADPMPGSDPQSELGNLWINAVADAVKSRLAEPAPASRWHVWNAWPPCTRLPDPKPSCKSSGILLSRCSTAPSLCSFLDMSLSPGRTASSAAATSSCIGATCSEPLQRKRSCA